MGSKHVQVAQTQLTPPTRNTSLADVKMGVDVRQERTLLSMTVLAMGGFVVHTKDLNFIWKATGCLCKTLNRK